MARPLPFPPPAQLPRLRRRLLDWHRRNGLHAPWRSAGDPYPVLVAAVMAQQTQMSRVLPKYAEFLAAYPTPQALAAAPTAAVLRIWGGLGYNLRALRLQRAARHVVREGGFPPTAEALQRIEGIGPFTAAIVASFALGQRVAAVDTNVRRVLTRLLATKPDARVPELAVEAAASALIAPRAAGRWNQAMMDLGARVCTARAPRCDACPLAEWCRARPRFAAPLARVAEAKAAYRPKQPFRRSRRYYRGRIVQALRELPPGASLTPAKLLERIPDRDGLDPTALAGLLASLQADGLLRILKSGRVRLP